LAGDTNGNASVINLDDVKLDVPPSVKEPLVDVLKQDNNLTLKVNNHTVKVSDKVYVDDNPVEYNLTKLKESFKADELLEKYLELIHKYNGKKIQYHVEENGENFVCTLKMNPDNPFELKVYNCSDDEWDDVERWERVEKVGNQVVVTDEDNSKFYILEATDDKVRELAKLSDGSEYHITITPYNQSSASNNKNLEKVQNYLKEHNLSVISFDLKNKTVADMYQDDGKEIAEIDYFDNSLADHWVSYDDDTYNKLEEGTEQFKNENNFYISNKGTIVAPVKFTNNDLTAVIYDEDEKKVIEDKVVVISGDFRIFDGNVSKLKEAFFNTSFVDINTSELNGTWQIKFIDKNITFNNDGTYTTSDGGSGEYNISNGALIITGDGEKDIILAYEFNSTNLIGYHIGIDSDNNIIEINNAVFSKANTESNESNQSNEALNDFKKYLSDHNLSADTNFTFNGKSTIYYYEDEDENSFYDIAYIDENNTLIYKNYDEEGNETESTEGNISKADDGIYLIKPFDKYIAVVNHYTNENVIDNAIYDIDKNTTEIDKHTLYINGNVFDLNLSDMNSTEIKNLFGDTTFDVNITENDLNGSWADSASGDFNLSFDVDNKTYKVNNDNENNYKFDNGVIILENVENSGVDMYIIPFEANATYINGYYLAVKNGQIVGGGDRATWKKQ